MEDFGYSKQQEENATLLIFKRSFLIGATLFSIACFVYITINAYYFIYNEKNNNIQTIKAAADPIKIIEEQEKVDDSMRIDNSIYEDIFGNRKYKKEQVIKVREDAKTAIPPKVNDVEAIVEKKAKPQELKNTTDKIIVYSDKKIEKENFLNPQNNLAQSNVNKDKKFVKVQIAALNSENSAKEYWQNLKNNNPKLLATVKYFIEPVNLGKRGVFYRLQIGNFFDQIRAEEFCNSYITQTKKSRADCIVVE